MEILRSKELPLQSAEDVIRARFEAKLWTEQMQFLLIDRTKVITAVSELARNAVQHGGGGIVRFEEIRNHRGLGLRVVFEDQGPGIADISLALRDGYSTAGGLGLGLGGAKRLTDEFDIQSAPGKGTKVTVIKWK
ncbi:MAG: anti-sigma regulatory factor [candidate division KSB1 bacterium]|nr:anti-sigma regulatory factor [candidate division KSB1 bacterium]